MYCLSHQEHLCSPNHCRAEHLSSCWEQVRQAQPLLRPTRHAAQMQQQILQRRLKAGRAPAQTPHMPFRIRSELIGVYDVERLNKILTAELVQFSDFKISFPPARNAVKLYRVTYPSVIPEMNNRPTTASGLIAIPTQPPARCRSSRTNMAASSARTKYLPFPSNRRKPG